jgi:hypothetical protein
MHLRVHSFCHCSNFLAFNFCLQEEGKVQSSINSSLCPMSKGCGMSVLVGTGHNTWSGLYIMSSTAGFVFLMYLVDIFYVNPFDIEAWWHLGILFLACMVASVFIFGGFVVGLWHLWARRISAKEQCEDNMLKVDKAEHTETVAHNDSDQESIANITSIRYGARPDFNGMHF